MAIQWFPGHMHLTKKAISERIKEIDVVIELLDARLPGSSANAFTAHAIASTGNHGAKRLIPQGVDPKITLFFEYTQRL